MDGYRNGGSTRKLDGRKHIGDVEDTHCHGSGPINGQQRSAPKQPGFLCVPFSSYGSFLRFSSYGSFLRFSSYGSFLRFSSYGSFRMISIREAGVQVAVPLGFESAYHIGRH